MTAAAKAGAVILPAMPGFYHGVKLIGDLVDFVVSRICDQLGVGNALIQRWGEGDDPGSGIGDQGSGIRDQGSGIGGQGLGIRD
jgi:hypothetical protein